MAKALFGHVGSPDVRLLGEVRRLQQRVQQLETQVGRLQAENDALRLGALERDLHQHEVDAVHSLDGVEEPALA
jgi:uncharacterized protein YlxW (UPF0749 family)